MGLSALQLDFQAWLVAEDPGAAARMKLADPRGLAVYQNNYRGQLMECLEASYPHTLAWLGETAFRAAAAGHVDVVPPHSWTLDDYATGFPASLTAGLPNDAEVAELAGLELALANAFVAADAIPIALQHLSEISWETAKLKLVPSAAVLDLATNAADIWLALDQGRAPPTVAMLPAPVRLLVWRQDLTCCYRELGELERNLLPKLASGVLFELLCDELVEQFGPEQGIMTAGELLARWAQAGLLELPQTAD